jgi:hypothetical protein
MEGQDPVFTSPRNRVAQLYPHALGSLFLSPTTTRRDTVEVFVLASTLPSQSQSHIATDGQSVCLSWCRAPVGDHDRVTDHTENTVSTIEKPLLDLPRDSYPASLLAR